MAQVRLYLDQPLGAGQSVTLTRDQAHYLFGVMRLSQGDRIEVFDGRTGAYRAKIETASKRSGTLVLGELTWALQRPPDVWLIFAPIKKERTDFIVEKAAELGARRIVPVKTDFTNSGRINQARLQAHAVEAAEQCGGTFVPEVADLQPLDRLLATWPDDRRILFCDESRVGQPVGFPDMRGPWAILIGPEGGFSDEERARLTARGLTHGISLGPRILRADTAAVAALTLWQSHLGDWGGGDA